MLTSLLTSIVLLSTALTWDEDPKALYKEGVVLFENHDYRAAELKFSRAYALSKKPGFLFNMAECARHQQHREQAVRWYEHYLREAKPNASQASLTRTRIASLRAEIQAAQSTSPKKTTAALASRTPPESQQNRNHRASSRETNTRDTTTVRNPNMSTAKLVANTTGATIDAHVMGPPAPTATTEISNHTAAASQTQLPGLPAPTPPNPNLVETSSRNTEDDSTMTWVWLGSGAAVVAATAVTLLLVKPWDSSASSQQSVNTSL